MALPWGSASSASIPTSRDTVEVRCLPCDLGSNLRRMFSPRAPTFQVDAAGKFVAAPGTAYEIEVVHGGGGADSQVYVVRGSIDGHEINEQLVLRGGSKKARFVGWLQDPTGAKRIRFTAPARSGETSLVQIAVFAATELQNPGKASVLPQAPTTAMGATFSGPTVGNARFALGEPVGLGMAQLRAD